MPADIVDEYLAELDATTRRVAPREWGVSIDDVAGWPLHVGLRMADGFLRAQAHALDADQVSDHELLYRNRGLLLVRYAHTGAGDVWVHGELAVELVTAAWLDRLLGFLVEAAMVARHRASASA